MIDASNRDGVYETIVRKLLDNWGEVVRPPAPAPELCQVLMEVTPALRCCGSQLFYVEETIRTGYDCEVTDTEVQIKNGNGLDWERTSFSQDYVLKCQCCYNVVDLGGRRFREGE
jgi:hypothetical protein